MYGMVSMAILYFLHQRLCKYGFQDSFNPQLPNSRGCPYSHCGPPRLGEPDVRECPVTHEFHAYPTLVCPDPACSSPSLALGYSPPPPTTTLGDAWLPLLEVTEAQGEAELPKFESFPCGVGRVWSTKGQGSRRPCIAPNPRLEHAFIHSSHPYCNL